MRENQYQAQLVKELRSRFPGCVILKNDPNYLQGIPDLTLLYRTRWAMLEVKASAASDVQPNQPYYVELLNSMSFAAFIYPEIQEEVLNDLERAMGRTRRVPRLRD